MRVFPDKGWRVRIESKHILQHKYLTVAIGRGADSDCGNGNLLRNSCRKRLSYGFEDDGERARFRNGLRISLDGGPFFHRSSLRFEAPEDLDHLGRHSDVAH